MTSSDDSRDGGFSSPYPYRVFDENGTSVLPCGKSHCVTKDGKLYFPAPTTCANEKCGKRFRPPCPGVIYCCRECFEATNTQSQWDAATKAKQEHKRQLAKERKNRYLHTEKGHQKKREQNKRCYQHRKEQGKPQAAYTRRKALQQSSVQGYPTPSG